MTRRGYFGWLTLAAATLAVAVLPEVLTLPEPDHVIAFDHAVYQADGDHPQNVLLPHAIYPWPNRPPETLRYLLEFQFQTVPDTQLFLYIPTINRRLSIALNGETLFNTTSNMLFWAGPFVSTSTFVQLPRATLVTGRNQLAITVANGRFAVPTYLSRMYLGSAASLQRFSALRILLVDQLKTVALAAHVLLGIGLIFACLLRPKDPLFAWLAAFAVASLVVSVGLFFGFQPPLEHVLPYIVALIPSSGILFIGASLALIERPPRKSLILAAVAASLLFLPFAVADTALSRTILAASSSAIIVAAVVVGTAIIAWGALRYGRSDARLMLAPSFLLAWFAVRDTYVTVTLPAHPFNLMVGYMRPLYVAGLLIVLMRRMVVSLDRVDRANETLSVKLAERETELAALHEQQRARTARAVREQERQRLTHDLHDGISGHLVSIIAMSERVGSDAKPIEKAAREALDDLRLVIYSLDLGDRELPVALANLRERLVPQLQRMGIELDWSIANLPEVSGVTPGNALTVLRIMQEAITNAIKHGPARRIVIRGATATDGAAITIENDGCGFVEGGAGRGLTNMRRRAERLNGKLTIGTVGQGVKLTLLLPPRLPDFEEDAA